MVTKTSSYTYLLVRSHHNHGAVPAARTGWTCVDPERNLARRRGRPHRMRCRAYWLVHARRVVTRDGGRTDMVQRSTPLTVSRVISLRTRSMLIERSKRILGEL